MTRLTLHSCTGIHCKVKVYANWTSAVSKYCKVSVYANWTSAVSRRTQSVYALLSHHLLGVQGFEMVAFPCNQFAGQAPGSSEEERQYAFRKFGFQFPIMVGSPLNAGLVCLTVYQDRQKARPCCVLCSSITACTLQQGSGYALMSAHGKWDLTLQLFEQDKIDVNGDQAHPLYRYAPVLALLCAAHAYLHTLHPATAGCGQ